MQQPNDASARPRRPENRFGLDYEAEAARFGAPVAPITDVHTHINGARASAIYRRVCDLYGVRRIYSMTRLDEVPVVRENLGDRIRFIAVPDFMNPREGWSFREGYLEAIEKFHAHGSRIVKFWCAPRSIDFGREMGDASLLSLDNPWRVRCMELAHSLGMMFMTHIADPDTWFRTKYADASIYGTKRQQYEPLERALEKYRDTPWIAAHMGGWPEDLEFLTDLLDRNPNLHLDSSATKWIIRELSRHSRTDLVTFLTRFKGRILFGSDIVTTDQHLASDAGPRGMGHLASSEEEAFDLYASRYWALRMLWETDYEGEANIADPDLALVDPASHDEMSAARLAGKSIPAELLRVLYHDAARDLLEPRHAASA